jgi:hypothetical protein
MVGPERFHHHHHHRIRVPARWRLALHHAWARRPTRLTWRGTFPSAKERARVIKEYGADKGLMQTMARLADYVAAKAGNA